MAAGDMLDVYFPFRLLPAAWEAPCQKRIDGIFGRCGDYSCDACTDAPKQGCFWRAYADWIVHGHCGCV